MDLTWTFELL